MEEEGLFCGYGAFLLCPYMQGQRLHGAVVPCCLPVWLGGVAGIVVTELAVMGERVYLLWPKLLYWGFWNSMRL